MVGRGNVRREGKKEVWMETEKRHSVLVTVRARLDLQLAGLQSRREWEGKTGPGRGWVQLQSDI